MKLKFKQQKYQEDACLSVVKCFEGQSKGDRKNLIDRRHFIRNEGTIWEEEVDEEVISFGNKKIDILDSELRKNIRNVQKQNNLEFTDKAGFENFSIEMETGTGKTYTYIKTMYELNKAYGWSKFIVIVPSIAIREGVLKSFQITEEHFQELYHKKIRYFVYNSNNSSNLSNINSFAEDSNINVMIMNYQAFNFDPNSKSIAKRKIYDALDELQSRRPIDVIKSTAPILIIDEPQKMGKTEERLNEFNPLFTLRYSATHKEDFKYNMIYRLDAVDAYNQKLVKKINVKGIEILHNKSEDTYLYLEGVDISTSDPVARMEIEKKSSSGVRKVMMKIKKNDNLFELSGGLEAYKGYVVSDIDARNMSYDKVSFINGVEITTGQVTGDAEESYMPRIQIRETIKSHFGKERLYFKQGIKVLSLFFIDEVKKYKDYNQEQKKIFDGEYAKIFEEEYLNVYNEYYNFIDEDYKKYLDSLNGKKVHSGYFSIDKKASKGLEDDELVFIDSKIDDKKEGTSSDEDAYDLIMKDKERLLSLSEPVRFIFSHSALREGWDNPNIFQICTLKKNNSEISKRQEIGRGLRICVNKNGDRMDYSELEDDFFSINNLTVIASESYDSFAKALQSEISKNLSRVSYDVLTSELFNGKILRGQDGATITGEEIYNKVYRDFIKNEYVDENDKITYKLREDINNNNLSIPDFLEEYKEDYTNLIKKLFTDTNIKIENALKDNIKILKPNDNFNKKEFQDLWEKINVKSVYEVKFDSNELIEKAIKRLDNELKITKMRVRITKGEQKETISAGMVKEESSMYIAGVSNEVYDDFVTVSTKYDLIGSVSKDTGLTRKTIIEILSKIRPDVFAQYQYNPEEFIRKACNLINIEKATTVIDGITYNKIDEKYDNEIFTLNNVNAKLGGNAIEVKKHIYDYLVTDSKNEQDFAKSLENGEVTVYAKLPNGFKIPTPVGNYNPDWAIVFDNKDFKYVYFIAETKGSMNSLELRDVEKAKIECARKHFESISNGTVKYDVVESYEKLVDLLTV